MKLYIVTYNDLSGHGILGCYKNELLADNYKKEYMDMNKEIYCYAVIK